MSDVSLNLTQEEYELLVRVLQHTLKERQIEEHRTESPLFREQVSREVQLLTSLLAKLKQPGA
jgi:hypothetical protein